MMTTAIPSRIMDYRVTASSPSEELMTLGQIFSEIGSYASTILDRQHTSLAKKCFTRLAKIIGELTARHKIQSEDCLHTIPEGALVSTDLATMTVGELYDLYRRWPLRHHARRAKGREAFTFYYEAKIVAELQRRTATGKEEQFKIDYCSLSYRNELENMAFTLSLPVGEPKEFDETDVYDLLHQAQSYTDVHGRERLIELIDRTLDNMEQADDKAPWMTLAAKLIEIGRKSNVTLPNWLVDFLARAVEAARNERGIERSDLVLPLLTLSLLNCDAAQEQEANDIINDCYTSALMPDLSTVHRAIKNLDIAVTYCDYVTDFDIDRIGQSWNTIASATLTTTSTHADISTLLTLANEIGEYTQLSSTLLSQLQYIPSNTHR